MKRLLTLAAVLATTPLVHAQLLHGNDASGTIAFYVDLDTGVSLPLWDSSSAPDHEAWGIAVDDASLIVYAADGADLITWAYNSQPAGPTLVATFTSSVNAAALSMVSLTWANGTLYGGRNVGDATNPKGIYRIDPNTAVATLAWQDPSGTTPQDHGGIEFNPADGLFWMCSDAGGAGVYTVDVLGAPASATFVTAYDGGETDVDGNALIPTQGASGTLYLVTDDIGDPLYNLDLGSLLYNVPTLTSPNGSGGIFASGAYAPSMIAPPVSYCTSGTTVNGCRASISGAGIASVSLGSGFTIDVANVEGNKNGIVFYGISGRAAAPWGGGSTSFLCVKSPTQRTQLQNAGGTVGACDGALVLDWNAYFAAFPSKAINQATGAGTVVNAQGWFRDPTNPRNTSLSDGLEFTVNP